MLTQRRLHRPQQRTPKLVGMMRSAACGTVLNKGLNKEEESLAAEVAQFVWQQDRGRVRAVSAGGAGEARFAVQINKIVDAKKFFRPWLPLLCSPT